MPETLAVKEQTTTPSLSPQDLRRYEMWRRRLMKTPSGAPAHPAVDKLLQIYCTPTEADFLSRMPATFSSPPQLAKLYKTDIQTISNTLEPLIDKMLVGDLDCGDGVHLYIPLEFIPGFWDLTFMRIRDDMPMTQLAELFAQYWETFYPEVLGHGKPIQDFRIMVHENSLPAEYTEILDYERTTHIVKTAKRICVGTCACCNMEALQDNPVCDRPQRTCMSFNAGADAVLRSGQGEEISTEEAMNIVDECIAHGMVQCADNVKTEPWYMCNCCSCCCHLFRSMRDSTLDKTVVSSNYIAEVDTEKCTDCGTCIKRCPADCIESQGNYVKVNPNKCVGCGVCQTGCPKKAITMNKRGQRIYTPAEYNEKVIAMSLERGRLADQLFHDPNKKSHRIICKIINTTLQTPPIKQLLTNPKIRHKFVSSIAKWVRKDMQKTIKKEKIRLSSMHP